jgi:hypothetical protein
MRIKERGRELRQRRRAAAERCDEVNDSACVICARGTVTANAATGREA